LDYVSSGKFFLASLLQTKIGVCKTCVSRNFGNLRRFAAICYKHIGYLCTRLPYLCVCSELLQIAANCQIATYACRFCRPWFLLVTTCPKKKSWCRGSARGPTRSSARSSTRSSARGSTRSFARGSTGSTRSSAY